MMRRILLLALLWAGTAGAASRPPVILVWGDSLSAAYGIEVSQGWVSLMQDRLKARGYDYTVVNGSVSGETTAGGLTRLPQALADERPAVVILELGANDGLRGTPVKVMQDDLGKMLDLSRKAGAKVLLVGIMMPLNYGQRYTDEFAAVYPALGKRYRVPVLPFLLKGVAEDRANMQADGLHPLASSEPRVLDNVWPLLEPLLHKAAAPAARLAPAH